MFVVLETAHDEPKTKDVLQGLIVHGPFANEGEAEEWMLKASENGNLFYMHGVNNV